ncbi:probable ubiquitin conjugation factor E4 [Papaver somniferum]|uniref:probable ubiquitin conjugation factor E4 n=1 Tax=Papaver somniferum TaxID=3469 RepID=UPI000E6F8B2B|nr:probable ubiquitin conjugation factor E4 [Papaver somniferum]
MNALLGYAPFPQPEQDMKLLPKEAKKDWRNYCCYISQILHDKALLKDALSFYGLMVVWLVGLAGGFKMPLPSSCPIEFACVPEHLVEDAIEMLIFVLRCSELLVDGIPEMDEFIKFIIMFMASPNYIRNPYIRERMVELLSLCLCNRRCACSVITVFKGSQLNLEFLVGDLLELYAKEVFTGSPNNLQFRKSILEILALINENINLLDSESFLWMQERDRMFKYDKDMIGRRISYRIASLEMLAFTSKQIIVPFLLPHMVDTVATMLNHILVHLLSLHTKSSFGTRRFMKCGCCLEILLKQIVSIYVHLARGDSENIFVAAICKDSQSYYEQLFIDVARVLDEDRLVPEFIELGVRNIISKILSC